MDRVATLRDLYRRVIKASGSTGGYLNNEPCMEAMLSSVIKLCSPQAGVPAGVTAGHKVRVGGGSFARDQRRRAFPRLRLPGVHALAQFHAYGVTGHCVPEVIC